MEHHFGSGITRHFMYPYNRKFWTVPPEQLIPDWTPAYVPLVNLRDVVDGAFAQDIRPLGYNSEFWYPRTGGMEQLVTAFTRQLHPVHTNHRVTAIDCDKRLVRFVNGNSARFTHLVSSIPLIEMARLLKPVLPRPVAQAFRGLRYVSVYNVNLGIDRPAITDKHWIYFPEKSYCFFRVGFPMNFSYDVTPSGTSSMYVEVSYSRYRPLRRSTLARQIRKDLISAGLLRQDDRILVAQHNDIQYAYSMYDQDYRENVRIINEFLRRHDIWNAGRAGRWQYLSMEDVLLDGQRISEEINGSVVG
jgi:UDP-galactopyranose mutase